MRVIRTSLPVIAHAVHLGPWSAVLVGPAFDRLPPREQASVLMHERGHIVMRHASQRRRWALQLRFLWDPRFSELVRDQEYAADMYAVKNGHAPGLLAFLARYVEIEPDPLHPSPRDRISRIKVEMQHHA